MTIINNRQEYHEAMVEIERYLAKGVTKLTPMEEEELEKLTDLVRQYEAIHFPMPVTHDLTTLIEAYMNENGLTKQKLAAFLGVGNSTLSEIMNKKRPMTLDLAKKMHNKMHFDGNMLLELI